MKVLLVSGIYFPDVGGPATFIPKLASYLVNKGHEVTTISLQDKPVYRPSEPWTRIFISRRIPKLIRFPITLIKVIRHGISCDVIFANGLHEESVIAAKIIRKKVFLKIVGDPIWERAKNRKLTNYDLNEFNSNSIPINLALERKLFNWTISNADLVITPSRELCDLMLKFTENCKTVMVPNGVVLQDFERNSYTQKRFDVIFVGRLTAWKEVDTLIRAVAISGSSLVIVGDGPEKNNLIKLANSLACKVQFVGEKSKPEIQEFLASSKIYCLPSSYEGMSHSLLEAMASGIPVIVSNIGPNLEIVKNNSSGITFRLRDENDLSLRIENLLASEKIMKELARKAKLVVEENYSEQNILAKYLNLMRIS